MGGLSFYDRAGTKTWEITTNPQVLELLRMHYQLTCRLTLWAQRLSRKAWLFFWKKKEEKEEKEISHSSYELSRLHREVWSVLKSGVLVATLYNQNKTSRIDRLVRGPRLFSRNLI